MRQAVLGFRVGRMACSPLPEGGRPAFQPERKAEQGANDEAARMRPIGDTATRCVSGNAVEELQREPQAEH